MATIAITGGSGFIGSALSQSLSDHFHVRILDGRYNPDGPRPETDFTECDVRSYQQVERALKGTDLVVHCAIVQIPQINQNKRLGYEVNIIGTQNVCEAVGKTQSLKGLILVGSWHTMGERNISGLIDEKFGFRPDLVEERSRPYALSKIAQETIVRYYDEDSQEKIYGIVRIGTTLGENMPEKTAANIFIEQALSGQVITPYEHSMHRPMLYVDIQDVCHAFQLYALKILEGKEMTAGDSLEHTVNLYSPEPTTILELAEIVKHAVTTHSHGTLKPEVRIVRTGQENMFVVEDKTRIRTDLSKARRFLGIEAFISPRESISRIVRKRLSES